MDEGYNNAILTQSVFIWFFCRIILPSAWSSSFPIHPQCVIVWGLWWHVRDTPARPNNSSMCIFHQKTSTRPCESCKNPASSGINVLNWQCIRWDFLCSRSISFLENKQKGLEFGKVPSGYSFCLFLGLTLHSTSLWRNIFPRSFQSCLNEKSSKSLA